MITLVYTAAGFLLLLVALVISALIRSSRLEERYRPRATRVAPASRG